MKNPFGLSLSIIFFCTVVTAQTQQFCNMSSISTGLQTPLVQSSKPVVLVLVDFADGRVANNAAPTVDADTAYPGLNIDAVGSMGYTDPRINGRKIIRKYVYEDYWNIIFSQNQYAGTYVHPDYQTHNGFIPPTDLDQSHQVYDLTVYGSVYDYWNEISYGNLQIQPCPTHSDGSDMYHTGIANRIDVANSKNYIHWITLPHIKSMYANPYTSGPNQIDPVKDAITQLENLHKLQHTDPNYIEFDVDAHLPPNDDTTKIAIMYAGGMPSTTQLGGWAEGVPSQECAFCEKSETSAYIANDKPGIIFTSVATLAHELGHTFGFPHFVAGSYDLMFAGGFKDRRYYFCPPHVNPKYKITMGWIPQLNIIKLNSDQTNISLPSIASTNQVAMVTVYGDPGRNIGGNLKTNFSHSEYFIVEYRKREKFNRFVGGPDNVTFAGGALIWHYSEYNTFPISGGGFILDANLGLKVANYGNSFKADPGDPSQLFYPNNSTLSSTTTPNSNSIENVGTGISLNSFAYNGNSLTFNVNYTLGAVPTYSQFYTSGNLPSSISGSVFIDGYNGPYSLSVTDHSHVDCSPGSSIYTYSLVANGSSQNSISFRGAGFGSSRVPWAGITLNAYIQNQSIINNCLITDANIYSTGIGVNAFIIAGYPVPTITNNQFQNCTTDIQTINYGSSYLELGGYGSNTYSNFAVRGNWKVTTPSTFTVPSGATMTVTPVSTSYNQPSTIQFASGGNLSCNGKLVVTGTSAAPVTFTSTGSTSPGSWGVILLNGSGANSSTINYANIQYGTEVRVTSANNVTIQNCSITDNSLNGINATYSSSLLAQYNTIKNTNGYHGIYITGGSNNNCYYNVISKTNHGQNGAGILYNGSSGTVGMNDIDYYNWGIAGIWGASPSAYINPWPSINNNRVTHCLIGLYMYHLSYGNFGVSTSYPSWGLNSIHDNFPYNALVGNGDGSASGLYAECDFWGTSSTTYVYPGCYGYFIYPLTADPWYGYPLPSIKSMPNDVEVEPSRAQNSSHIITMNSIQTPAPSPSTPADSLLIGVELRGEHKHKEAKNLFMSHLSKHPADQAAYVYLYSCADSETTPEIIQYFKNLPKQAANDHKLLLSNLYLMNGDISSAKQVNNAIIAANPNTRLAVRAKLNNLSMALYLENDVSGATALLDQVEKQASLSTPMEILTAEAALKSYVDPKTGQMPKINRDQSDNLADSVQAVNSGLLQNYPNPFNPTTTISYRITQSGKVSLKIFDVLGREVATLVNSEQGQGVYTQKFDASHLSSGIYFYQLNAPGINETRKMLIMK